jgi:hypothetical protein
MDREPMEGDFAQQMNMIFLVSSSIQVHEWCRTPPLPNSLSGFGCLCRNGGDLTDVRF